MDSKMNLELLKFLEKLAAKTAAADDEEFNAYDYSGGNFDDAYSTGCSDGQIYLARSILKKLKG